MFNGTKKIENKLQKKVVDPEIEAETQQIVVQDYSLAYITPFQ